MSGRKTSKTNIHASKPELPPFLQRMKEQIVANEDSERRERSQKRHRERPEKVDDPSDEPTIVKLSDEDLTEEEYKRMKKELETQYKLDENKVGSQKHEDLDVDVLIQNRNSLANDKDSDAFNRSHGQKTNPSSSSSSSSRTKAPFGRIEKVKKPNESALANTTKALSYGSSSDEED